MPWAHWWDGKKAVSQQWDVEGYPTLYVIDHKGVIRFKTLGLRPEEREARRDRRGTGEGRRIREVTSAPT
jgi:hypothetical protein